MGLDQLTLADVLTPAGFVAAAMLITGVVALLKNVPAIGPWLDAGNEQLVALLLAGIVVVLAVADAGSWRGLAALFQAFVCWYGIATLTVGMHAAGTGVQRAIDPQPSVTVTATPTPLPPGSEP